jgi:hypothetical protein
MRKYMTKEVTSTELKLAKLVIGENGLPVADVIPSHVVLGELTPEKAQKLISKKYPSGVTIYAMETKTSVYKMSVADFIKVAELIQEGEEVPEEEVEEEEVEEEEEEEQTPTPKTRRITANNK